MDDQGKQINQKREIGVSSEKLDKKMRGLFLILNLLGLITAIIGDVMNSNPAVVAGLGMALAAVILLSLFL